MALFALMLCTLYGLIDGAKRTWLKFAIQNSE